MSVRRTAARLLAAPAAAAVLALSIAGPASAHVTITPNTTEAGAFAVLTVSVPHGCDGSATTKIDIEIPEAILSVTPTRNPLWDVDKKIVPLEEPTTDAHGNTVTERVGIVTYTAKTPLPEGYRDTFELSLQIPDAEGTVLNFPVLQTCEKGSTAWSEVAAEGQDAEELEHPAPTVTITGSVDEVPAPGTITETDDDDVNDADDSDDEDDSSLGAWGLGAGALGVLLGGAALIQGRRKP